MTRNPGVSAIALAIAVGWAIPAQAQSADTAAIRQEMEAMRAQTARMAQRIDTLETALAAANAKADAAQSAAASAAAAIPAQVASAQTATAKPATQVTWDGAPKLSGEGGWSFKPRGRLQVDVGSVDGPGHDLGGLNLGGVTTELRRAYIGFEGTMPGGFGYRVEADLADSSVKLTDLYLTYKASPQVTLTLGQHKPFWSLEEMTSDLFTPFMERAAYSGAFGFERRVGFSAAYAGKDLLLQGGVFADDAESLAKKDEGGKNNSYSLDGRIVYMPKLAGGQLHIGGSVHFRDFNDVATKAGYSARPFVHTTDLKLVNTGDITSATGERGIGAELAYIRGRFHATAESLWQTVRRSGLPDPTFNGGYAEVGYLLTDDTTAYKGGAYDRIRPKSPVGKGGIGAVQVNLRYDWLDLNDAGIVGGRQQVAGVSLLWVPADYVRFLVNYGHIWLDDAAVPAGADRSYNADAFGMRAQFDF